MKKVLSFVFSLGIALFIISCSGSDSDRLAQTNFKQGSGGVEVTFLENAPPEVIYPGADFKIVLDIANLAAYDVLNGYVKIVGVNHDYFAIQPLEQYVAVLDGRSMTNPEGGREFVEFLGRSGTLFLNAQERVEPYIVKFRFDSTVEFGDSVCINSKLYEVYDAGCQVETSKSYSGQGAPLGIGSLEEIIIPGDNAAVEFRLHVENLGSGEVGKVVMGKGLLGGEEIGCYFQEADEIKKVNEVTFAQKRQSATIVCKKYLTDTRSYTTTLSVDLSYDYKMEQEGQLRLVSAEGER